VVAWLEREGLGSLCLIAREQEFNGGILLTLHTEVKKENGAFKLDCLDLGIPVGAVQITLKGKLVALWMMTEFFE